MKYDYRVKELSGGNWKTTVYKNITLNLIIFTYRYEKKINVLYSLNEVAAHKIGQRTVYPLNQEYENNRSNRDI